MGDEKESSHDSNDVRGDCEDMGFPVAQVETVTFGTLGVTPKDGYEGLQVERKYGTEQLWLVEMFPMWPLIHIPYCDCGEVLDERTLCVDVGICGQLSMFSIGIFELTSLEKAEKKKIFILTAGIKLYTCISDNTTSRRFRNPYM